MEKQRYRNLMRENHEGARYQMMDILRDDLSVEDSEEYATALSVMALALKRTKDKSAMMNHIEEHIDDETTLNFLRKIEKENYNYIEDLSNQLDEETLQAIALFSEPKRYTDIAVNSTPEGLSELAISLLDLKEDDTILDLGSGVGSFLIQAAYASGSKNLYGVEINTKNVIISNLRRFVTELPIKIIQGNIISQEYSSLSANKVFSNYPFGMRLPDLQNYLSENQKLLKYFKKSKRTASGDWVFSLGAYLNTSMPGKTIVLMTNAGTWNKPDEELRKKLISSGIVEGIISLPERLFTSTAIPVIMLVLSQNNDVVKMVDASEVYTEGRRQNLLKPKDIERITEAYKNECDISKLVTKDVIAGQEYILNPQRYIGNYIDIPEGVPLGEFCISVNRGAMIKSSELDKLASTEDTDYHYLMLQNIQDGVIDLDLPSLTRIDEKYQKHCISDRNLIISKNSPFKVAMAHVEKNKTILASGNLYFIDLDADKVNPVFVEIFLQSEAGMAQLSRLSKGSIMKNISIQDLKKIKIPDLPRENQDLIAEEYENLNDELIVLQKQGDIINDKKAKLLEGVI